VESLPIRRKGVEQALRVAKIRGVEALAEAAIHVGK
jgi:hypothetical protein